MITDDAIHSVAIEKALNAYGKSYLLKKSVDDAPEYGFNDTWIVYNMRESERQLTIARSWRKFAEWIEHRKAGVGV